MTNVNSINSEEKAETRGNSTTTHDRKTQLCQLKKNPDSIYLLNNFEVQRNHSRKGIQMCCSCSSPHRYLRFDRVTKNRVTVERWTISLLFSWKKVT